VFEGENDAEELRASILLPLLSMNLKGLSFISNRQRRNEGTFCASGLAGIEPTPPAPEDKVCAKPWNKPIHETISVRRTVLFRRSKSRRTDSPGQTQPENMEMHGRIIKYLNEITDSPKHVEAKVEKRKCRPRTTNNMERDAISQMLQA
jgi:hypothetical protein